MRSFVPRITWWRLKKRAMALLSLPPNSSVSLTCSQVSSEADFLRNFLVPPASSASISIDLGCGSAPNNPLGARNVLGIDILPSDDSRIIQCDLFANPIPLASDYADVVSASNFIEHVPRVSLVEGARFPFVSLMNEIHRVLKPNGIFYSKTPAYPFVEAFQDPTHANIITEQTMPCYFCSDHVTGGPWAKAYGFAGEFKLITQKWDYHWLLTVLKKL
jgi:SAM-dependent methyltransferase